MHYHNPFNLNVRATAQELTRLGAEMARRLNVTRGPIGVLVPRLGWSQVGSPGGTLHDPQANLALLEALRAELRHDIPLEELDLEINDPRFADACLERFRGLTEAGALKYKFATDPGSVVAR